MIFVFSLLISITHIWHAADMFNSVLVWYTIFTPALFAFVSHRDGKKDETPLYLSALAVAAFHYGVMHIFFDLNYSTFIVMLLAVSISLFCARVNR